MAQSGLTKPMTLSPELAAVVGAGPMSRAEVTKALWKYIKENNLQDENDKRTIVADEKLKKLFDGQEKVNMFEMTKLVSKHLS
jgi:upstream activation factor subunit UAF30